MDLVITKRQIYNDVFNREDESNLPSIDEIKDSNKLIFGQLDKILEFVKNNLDDAHKKLILSYISENLNN